MSLHKGCASFLLLLLINLCVIFCLVVFKRSNVRFVSIEELLSGRCSLQVKIKYFLTL